MACKNGVCSLNRSKATPQAAQNMGLNLPQQNIPKSSFHKGTPAHERQFNLFTPQQANVQNSALQNALGLLQGGQNPLGNSFDFAPIADEARSQFYSGAVPTLAERFTSMGAGGQG